MPKKQSIFLNKPNLSDEERNKRIQLKERLMKHTTLKAFCDRYSLNYWSFNRWLAGYYPKDETEDKRLENLILTHLGS